MFLPNTGAPQVEAFIITANFVSEVLAFPFISGCRTWQSTQASGSQEAPSTIPLSVNWSQAKQMSRFLIILQNSHERKWNTAMDPCASGIDEL